MVTLLTVEFDFTGGEVHWSHLTKLVKTLYLTSS